MSQDFRRIFYYSPQRVAVERYATLFEISWELFVSVGRNGMSLRGHKEGMFWSIYGHPEQVPAEIMEQLRMNGFEIVQFDDHYHRMYYSNRQQG